MTGTDEEFLASLKRQIEGANEAVNDNKNIGDGVPHFKIPRDGRWIFRILPPLKKANGEFAPVGVNVYKHWNLPGDKKALNCMKTFGLECPICNTVNKFKELNVDVNDYKHKVTAHFNALVIEGLDKDGKPVDKNKVVVVGGPPTNYTWLLDLMMGRWGNITNPNSGNDVEFKRERKDGKLLKQVQPSSAIAADQASIDEILSKRVDLEKLEKQPDDNYFQNYISAATSLGILLEKTLASSKIPTGNVVTSTTPASASQPPSMEELKAEYAKNNG